MTVRELINELLRVPQKRQVVIIIGGNKAPVDGVEIDDSREEVRLS